MKLWTKIFIGMFLGTITGSIIGSSAEYIKPAGTIFLSLINMIIPLLVLSSMTVGITSIHDPQKLGRVGIKTLILYLATTLAAIFLGIFYANLFHVGESLNFQINAQESVQSTIQHTPSLSKILLSMVPNNPIASLVDGNMLQIIIFSLFLGIAINFAGEKGKPLVQVLESLADVMYRLTSIVMELAPIGVFAIMAWVSGTFGLTLLIPLIKFLLVYYLASLTHVIIIYGGILRFAIKLNTWPFFKGMGDAIMMAFSTCSSSATLPVSMHCAQENLGISRNIASFVLPLGSTINMNGTAIFQTMSAIFIAHAYDIPFTMGSYFTLVVITTLSAIGTAGVSGAGFIMLSAVFTSMGLPLEGLALLVGIDRLREMVSTVLNITGDAIVAVYVAKTEGEFDEQQYYNAKLVEFNP